MGKNALTLKNVYISYYLVNSFGIRSTSTELKRQKIKRFYAINDVSFDLNEGQILGVIGRNGSGKSTLLKAISGIFSPDSGSINLHGNKVSLLSIGVGFQTSLSGYDNIFLSGMLLGISKEEIKKKVDDIIEFSELSDFIFNPVGTYSSGMASKLAFSISSNLDTDILLIDEVLSVGDVGFRKKSFEKIHEIISDESKTVLIVSHSEKLIKEQCDKALWLEKGEVMNYGEVGPVLDSYLEFMDLRKGKNADLIHSYNLE